MDLLGEILSSVRSVSPLLADLRMSGVWGIDFEEGGFGTPFHYVACGSCWLLIGDVQRLLKRGDLVLLPPWPRHALASEPSALQRPIRQLVAEWGNPAWTVERGVEVPINIGGDERHDVEILSGIFGFDSLNAAFLTETLPAIMLLETSDDDLSPWLDAMLSLIRRERQQASAGFTAVAGRGMEFIFIHALRTWIAQSAQPSGWLRGILDPHIGRTLHAIHADPRRDWSLEALARQAGQSRAVFANRFRAVMNETPFGYLTRWRMSQAAAKLTRTDNSIATIALELGYGSAFALSRAFRLQFHCTPAQYRRRSRFVGTATESNSVAPHSLAQP